MVAMSSSLRREAAVEGSSYHGSSLNIKHVGPRRFTATVEIVRGTRRAVETVVAAQLEVNAKFETEQLELPAVEPELPVVCSETPAIKPEAQPSMEVQAPLFSETDNGWTTPVSDPDSWRDVYEAAADRVYFTFGVGAVRGLSSEQCGQFRSGVTALLRSLGCVGPWSDAGSGVSWIRLLPRTHKVIDPTVRGFRVRKDQPAPTPVKVRGDVRVFAESAGALGAARDARSKDINGLPSHPAQHQAVQERREQRILDSSYEYPGTVEQRTLAMTLAGRCASLFPKRSEESRLAYKLGYVASLHSQKALEHTLYRDQLRECDQELLRSVAKALNAAQNATAAVEEAADDSGLDEIEFAA
jgi:hypothetical protein